MSAAKGDQVKQGDVLIEYEPVDKSSEIRQEELTYQKLQIQLEDAQQTLKEQAAAEGVSDTLKNNVKKLQLDLELSQERLNNFLKLAGSPDPVLAPISGELIELVPLKGDQLTPGATVAKVANYKLLEVKIEVDELDVIKLKTGVKADLTFDALPNEVFKGEVNSISNQGVADNGVSVYDVLIRFTPVEGIRSGMSVQASIVTSEKTDALLLSIEAVEEVSGKKRVTLHKEANDSNSRQTVDIRTGLFDETNIEVVDGLKEGDTVILPATQAGKKSSLNPMSGPGGF
jgi:HlyD family secretion protein